MSQHVTFDYDEPWIPDALDLSIETLTGTTFEIRVAPEDTIMSIKTKIQRVEGILVSQQHLLYNLVELDNSSAVKDYSIPNGAVLKLVLSMRGGPISTRRLPPADEALWREVQEWMSDSRREDRHDHMSSAAKTSIVVFRDGNSVNLFRVVENDDGTYSPVSQSPSTPSLKDLLAKDDPSGFGKRMMENWVTMGKMQELKGKLEKMSITKKDKKPGEDIDDGDSDDSEENITVPPSFREGYLRFHTNSSSDVTPDSSQKSYPLKPKKVFAVNEGASCSGLSSSRNASQSARLKARKDADNILRLQAKSLSVAVDGFGSMKRAPLPDIRRSRPDRLSSDEKVLEEKSETRGKTGGSSRMPTSTFAILEEESDIGPAPSICSSASSLVALPSNDDVVVAYSPMSREHGSASIGSRSFRLSRYVMNNAERPKTAPNQVETKRTKMPGYDDEEAESQNEKMINQVMCSTVDLAPLWCNSKARVEIRKMATQPQRVKHNECRYLEQLRVVTQRPARPCPPAPLAPAPSSPAKLVPSLAPAPSKPRCMVCRKRLNITNTHSCRCNGIFCSTHRYSETHDCHFDYKEEGKHLLRLSNPLVTAPKLPKI